MSFKQEKNSQIHKSSRPSNEQHAIGDGCNEISPC